MPRLKITTGKQTGKSFELVKTSVIGRSDTAEVQISDNSASREHCKVFEQGDAWVVADLNSRNGIKVNGVATTRKNLMHGDKIVIGETTLQFEMTAAAKPAAGSAGGAAKEAAFAAARAGTAPPKRGSPAPARAAAADSGLKVSDRVLQFSKVDTKNATVLDIDLTQSAWMGRLLVTLACIGFLVLVVWLVIKLTA